MRRSALLVLTLPLIWIVAAGCSSVRPFAASSVSDGASGDFAYVAGRATRTFPAPPATVQPAVLSALDDLRVGAIRRSNNGGTMVIEGTTADNRKALLTLGTQPGTGSRLTARVGIFGDEPLSRALMDRVAIRLGTLPPTAVPVDPPSSPDANPYFSRKAVPDALMLKDQADAPFRASPTP
jgi:Protein of unknown function (DUF3568)